MASNRAAAGIGRGARTPASAECAPAGLVLAGNCRAARREQAISTSEARTATEARAGEVIRGVLERFSSLLSLADEEASRLRQGYIGDEHVLLAVGSSNATAWPFDARPQLT